MIVIIDYGVGNLFSLYSSFLKIGEKVIISSDVNTIKSADKLILPGVGAFRDASIKLASTGLRDTVISAINNGVPVMGICLGMQLLFEKSWENGEFYGLGLINGEVVSINKDNVQNIKIPHMGWNNLIIKKNHYLFKYIKNNDYVYFVHSYKAIKCDDSIIATTNYGTDITAVVAKDNIIGCQFHPEKSGEVGLKILKAFCDFSGG